MEIRNHKEKLRELQQLKLNMEAQRRKNPTPKKMEMLI